MKMKNRVLAVLALALLIINMAPVKRAEAAETKTFVVPWGSEMVEVSSEGYEYYVILYDYIQPNHTCVIFSNEKLAYDFTSSTNVMVLSADNSASAVVYGKCPDISGSYESTRDVLSLLSNSGYGLYWSGSYHSNYAVGSYPDNPYVAPEPDPIYAPDAPYLKDVVFGSINNFRLDRNTDFTQSFFNYAFELGNADSEFVSRKAKISGYVYLPSKEFIDKAKDYYLSGRKYFDEFYSIYSCEYFPTWLKDLDVGDGSTSKKWYFTTEFDCTDSTVLRLSNQEIYDLVEQTNGVDLKEYYDIYNAVLSVDDILKGYMWVHRLDGVVYTTYSDVVNYGNLTSFVCSNYLKDPVISIGNSDPLSYGPPVDFVGPMLPDADVHQSIEQAYKDALEEARKDYENNLELDGDSEGLFDLFGSLSDGISDMSGSFRKIALAVGNVFAFFPGEVTTVLYAGLIAMIVVAVYKAIRG